jgi:phosphoglycerate dehydrogenase-like enzyme
MWTFADDRRPVAFCVVITLHVPLLHETKYPSNERRIGLMKPDGCVVNPRAAASSKE